MEDNKKSYFGEIGAAMKTLAVGMKTTWKEYFTTKSTEQYPENRKTTLHVAARHRGRLVMNRDENDRLCGDVDYNSVFEKAGAITPVPGGVGPMTIAMLMTNCVEAVENL